MKLEDQVCSLELAKKLKELGVKQESLFYWFDSDLLDIHKEIIKVHFNVPFKKRLQASQTSYCRYVSTFTASELGELLPGSISPEDSEYGFVLTINIGELYT